MDIGYVKIAEEMAQQSRHSYALKVLLYLYILKWATKGFRPGLGIMASQLRSPSGDS